jgi:hypothetical protein
LKLIDVGLDEGEVMDTALAQAIVDVVGAYFALGAAFALVFLSFGLRRLDPVAASGPLRFKLLIAPGIVALWPVMLAMWLFGGARREP